MVHWDRHSWIELRRATLVWLSKTGRYPSMPHCPIPRHTHSVSHSNRGGSSFSSCLICPSLPPFIPPFLALAIPGTKTLAQCKLFSFDCRRLGANHITCSVWGYFIQVTMLKHQSKKWFPNSHKNKVAFVCNLFDSNSTISFISVKMLWFVFLCRQVDTWVGFKGDWETD